MDAITTTPREPTISEEDGFRIEAAEQCGFIPFDDGVTEYRCSEESLIWFAKACLRAGRAQAIAVAKNVGATSPYGAAMITIQGVARTLEAMNKRHDDEIAPFLAMVKEGDL
ncbi:MAG: hypothetical protein HXX10_07425 [Rhodoplanes sp.]|uniref:hypothetical protein n=1 Tax=Rhodoplanes sp. TaxID=1968906 RepID=UPI00183D24A0|nr:hypothetical protein [Rhodoplanes sp.]NVO13850.1 hypothetical protein [Rhodoplanes sp.]